MMSMKYKGYGIIYSEQCVNCIREGTPYCRLEVESETCRNYRTLDDLKILKGKS